MSDPTLVRSRVLIAYTGSDGYRSEMAGKVDQKTVNLRTGEPVHPKAALMAGLRELARITAIFGLEDEALKEFNEARQAVSEWRAARGKS